MMRTQLFGLQVIFARRFQTTILSLLITNDHSEVSDAIKYFHELPVSMGIVYLLLPSVSGKVDWCRIKFSASPVYEATDKDTRHCHSCKDADFLQTKDGPFCRCMLQNSVVYTPHNRKLYNVTGFLDINAKACLPLKDGHAVSYKSYFQNRHGLCLTCENQPLLGAGGLFKVQNFLRKCYEKRKEPGNGYSVELPPELCRVVMAPVSANTLCSFSFFNITLKILEALTTKECQEEFSLESLETVGDSFIKYVTGQHLFSKYKHHREDILSSMRENLVSNSSLCQMGCSSKLVGYIRGEEFNPKGWIIPGLGYDTRGNSKFFFLHTNNMYSLKKISVRSKRIADTVEALTGAYLTAAGEQAAMHFLKSLGMDIELQTDMQDGMKIFKKSEGFEEFINVRILGMETILGYVFNDRSLLVEALTHSSYKIAGSGATSCNERLEFLGDSVLDHIITMYFYKQYYPACTPELLTNLRKASVNNHCYAHAAVKAGLHKNILHASSEQMINDIENSGRSFSGPSHGWEPGIGLPEDLADLIEAIAGAIYLDSKRDKAAVWGAMRRLLEPLATAETVEPDPVTELKELCDQRSYPKPSYSRTRQGGVTTVVAKVKAAGRVRSGVGTGGNKDAAQMFAAKALLQELKGTGVVS
ncbi:hypothetical protein ACP4OV_004996 [Aristida adscensionis]